jgi:hypothetical protein
VVPGDEPRDRALVWKRQQCGERATDPASDDAKRAVVRKDGGVSDVKSEDRSVATLTIKGPLDYTKATQKKDINDLTFLALRKAVTALNGIGVNG